jgi:hypothetical protein
VSEFGQLQAFNAIRDARAPFLRGGSAKSVLYALASFAGADGWAWPSLETLGAAAGLSKRSTWPIVEELTNRGVLEVVRGSQHASNRYRIRLDALRDLVPRREAPSPLPMTRGEATSPLSVTSGEASSLLEPASREEASPLDVTSEVQRGRTCSPEGKDLPVSGEATSPEGTQEGAQMKEEERASDGGERERIDLGGLEAETWAEGISFATKNPCSVPIRGPAEAIRRAHATHCPKGLDAEQRRVWLRDKATAYALANRRELLTGWNFENWCNSKNVRSRVQPIGLARPPVSFGAAEALAEAERQRREGGF